MKSLKTINYTTLKHIWWNLNFLHADFKCCKDTPHFNRLNLIKAFEWYYIERRTFWMNVRRIVTFVLCVSIYIKSYHVIKLKNKRRCVNINLSVILHGARGIWNWNSVDKGISKTIFHINSLLVSIRQLYLTMLNEAINFITKIPRYGFWETTTGIVTLTFNLTKVTANFFHID